MMRSVRPTLSLAIMVFAMTCLPLCGQVKITIKPAEGQRFTLDLDGPPGARVSRAKALSASPYAFKFHADAVVYLERQAHHAPASFWSTIGTATIGLCPVGTAYGVRAFKSPTTVAKVGTGLTIGAGTLCTLWSAFHQQVLSEVPNAKTAEDVLLPDSGVMLDLTTGGWSGIVVSSRKIKKPQVVQQLEVR